MQIVAFQKARTWSVTEQPFIYARVIWKSLNPAVTATQFLTIMILYFQGKLILYSVTEGQKLLLIIC
jgi:hypothetical protein